MPNTLVSGTPPAAPSSPALHEVEDAIIDFFQHAASLLGAPKSLAGIYGLFFASTTPLCLQDVAERLNLSQGSVSNGLRFLKEHGALKVVPGSQSRREYYAIDLHMRNLIRSFIDQRLNSHLQQGSQQLDAIKSKLRALHTEDDSTLSGSAALSERLDQLEDWHGKTRSLLPLIKTFLAIT